MCVSVYVHVVCISLLANACLSVIYYQYCLLCVYLSSTYETKLHVSSKFKLFTKFSEIQYHRTQLFMCVDIEIYALYVYILFYCVSEVWQTQII